MRALSLTLGAVLVTTAACSGAGPCPEPARAPDAMDRTPSAAHDANSEAANPSGPTTVSAERAVAIVEADLAASSAAWNRGDLETFVSSYAEDAVFVSPSGITRGRAAVLARYRKKYGEAPETMGELALEVLDTRPAHNDRGEVVGMAVVGHWQVKWPDREPPKDVAEGHTLLVYRPGTDGRWRIVHDASM